MKKLLKNIWFRLFLKISIISLIVFLILHFIIGIDIYYGNNMSPMLTDGTLVITYKLNKTFYGNEVVLYRQDDKIYYGRIIGLPGDIVEINETGNVYINNNIIVENIYYHTYADTIEYPYQVKDGEYFILNDYRENTNDSRRFGGIPSNQIDGEIYLEIKRRGF